MKTKRLSLSDLDAWTKTEFPVLVEMLKNAVKHFYGDKYRIEVSEDCVSIGKTISISPIAITQQSILGSTEYPGWNCMTYKTLPATHWEPEDYQEIELDYFRSTAAIVQAAIQHFHNIVEINPYFEQLADEAYAKQLENDPEYF